MRAALSLAYLSPTKPMTAERYSLLSRLADLGDPYAIKALANRRTKIRIEDYPRVAAWLARLPDDHPEKLELNDLILDANEQWAGPTRMIIAYAIFTGFVVCLIIISMIHAIWGN